MSKKNKSHIIKGVVFDIGDTLLETGTLMRAGIEYAAREVSAKGLISNPQKLIEVFFEVDERTVFPHISHLYSHAEIVAEALEMSGVITQNKFSLKTIACIFLAHYRDKVKSEVFPNKEISQLLEELKRLGIKLGVVSNGLLQDQIDVLERLKITDFFNSILISEELNIEKPEPKIFLISAEQLGLDKKSILYIGDNWETDVYGPLNAGLQVSLCVQFTKADLEKAKGTANCSIIYKLEDVIKLVSSSEAR